MNCATDICYYCGEPAVSEDHLPPDNIFDKPLPPNRIHVRSCNEHNSNQSKDDEYFRWFIATTSAESIQAQNLIKSKIKRQFERKPKLLFDIMKHSTRVNIFTEAGLYVETLPAFEYKRERVQSVITRMTKGFFLNFFNERLPDNYEVKKYLLNPKLKDKAKDLLIKLPLHEIDPNRFSFRFQRDIDDPYFTVWFFMFFEQTLIVSLTNKINRVD